MVRDGSTIYVVSARVNQYTYLLHFFNPVLPHYSIHCSSRARGLLCVWWDDGLSPPLL